MNYLINDIKILFCDMHPEKIQNLFTLDTSLRNIDSNTHQSISQKEYNNYSYNLYPNNSVDEREVYYRKLIDTEEETDFHTHFDLLAKFGEETIVMNGDIPLINFDRIIEWRDVSHKIGQAEIVSAYLAKKTVKEGANYTYWNWPTALKTNNRQLLHILREGTSENHFHLNGSTQIFPISWVSIMNNPTIIPRRLKKIDSNLYPRLSFGYNDTNESWERLLKKAALIRIKLFSKMFFEKNYNVKSGYFENVNEFGISLISLSEIENSAKRMSFQFAYKTEQNAVLDYALTQNFNEENFGYNRILIGERKFLYDCFKNIFSGKFNELEKNQFYYYLIVKNKFRSELIQSNNMVGFKNFSKYQDRKGYFFSGIPKYEKEAIRLSLNDTLQCQSIKSLETRIMPMKTPYTLIDSIEFYNKCYYSAKLENKKIHSNTDDFSDLLKKKINKSSFESDENQPYFFVLHYPKDKTSLPKYLNAQRKKKRNNPVILKARNSNQRKNNELYSKSIAYALFRRNDMRKMIRGIDTCSFEIYCRPEVFATDYRFLKNSHSIDASISSEKDKKRFLYLGKTYHAGEDFYDIVDGIRAIDEVIRFLEYSNGDRIGHALALGLNADDYYKSKKHKIIIPKQEALDNFIWLYYRALELNISIEPLLEQQIKYWINELSMDIYGDFCNRMGVNINDYNLYCAWKLRGDSPDLYIKGSFNKPKILLNQYEKSKFIDNDYLRILRKDKNISSLYFAYHYDGNARIKGEMAYEFTADKKYINLVKMVQKKMQFEIAKKDIMIECNPSSNYLISNITSYEEHPITTFNNLGLEYDPQKIRKCAQLSVSINTDDQGVFDTSLEYEYALMASALIKSVDENGNNKYSPMQVYNYINNIRIMGNEQTFLKI